MSSGPTAALPLVDELLDEGALDRYHLLHSVRGDLLARLDRHEEAADAFERAASLATNEPERALSVRRAVESRTRAEVAPDRPA